MVFRIAVSFILGATLVGAAAGAESSDQKLQLRTVRDGEYYDVEVLLGGKVLFRSAEEGLWSIATDWKDGWPDRWRHGKPVRIETLGPWTILHGEIDTEAGRWQVRDSYRLHHGTIRCVRRFTWDGTQSAERVTLSVRFLCPGKGAGAVLPGILYHGNPSGARSGRVPVYSGTAGEEAIFEEHRFPMPFACLEWYSDVGWQGAALHSLPSPIAGGNRPDQWWSLGLVAKDRGTEFVLLSGPCASNGRRSVIKAAQGGFVPYDDAFIRVESGTVIEKTFFLQAYPVEREGAGFQKATEKSLRLFAPYSLEGMPTFADIIRAKCRYAKTRWHEDGDIAGFKKYVDRGFLVFGWCGQAAAPGYALQVLADGLDDPAAMKMVQASLDFVSTPEFYEEGFRTWYDLDKRRWVARSRPELLSQGQAMFNYANAIRVGRTKGLDVSRWEAFLQKACDFHAKKILADDWDPLSTNQAFFIAPLCKAYEFFGVETYRRAAIKAGDVYGTRHVNMREPYWGGTLDASCEDKEGAFAGLQGFLALHELTGETKYLRWAKHAGDVALTYVVVWDIDLPAGRLRDHGFKTRGWTAVSVQNQHIDVYGVLIAPDIYRLGQLLEDDTLKRLAILMFRSCGQLIDPYGSQGEQPHHTNYAQDPKFRAKVQAGDISDVRGNYVEHWTVFWITAHFLNAAAQFKELGVDVWQ